MKVVVILGTIVMILWGAAEFPALPALFAVIGLLNEFPWQYYAITVGGYFGIFLLIELVVHLVFKVLDKNILRCSQESRKSILNEKYLIKAKTPKYPIKHKEQTLRPCLLFFCTSYINFITQ